VLTLERQHQRVIVKRIIGCRLVTPQRSRSSLGLPGCLSVGAEPRRSASSPSKIISGNSSGVMEHEGKT
jgi:hypothetical protein